MTKQQEALLGTEGLVIQFNADAVEVMAELAAEANSRMENIGARRLMTIMEKLFEEISFDAPEMVAGGTKELTVTSEMVKDRLSDIIEDEDLSKFVL